MSLTITDVTHYLTANDLQFELAGEKTVVVSLPGTNKQFVNVAMTIGDTIFKIESFVARNPDENHEAVYRWILEQNRKLKLCCLWYRTAPLDSSLRPFQVELERSQEEKKLTLR